MAWARVRAKARVPISFSHLERVRQREDASAYDGVEQVEDARGEGGGGCGLDGRVARVQHDHAAIVRLSSPALVATRAVRSGEGRWFHPNRWFHVHAHTARHGATRYVTYSCIGTYIALLNTQLYTL